MGRLLSSVSAALGLTPSDRVTAKKEQTNKLLEPEASEDDIEDCTTCRIVGSTAMTGCGVYCIAVAWRNPKQLSGTTLRIMRTAGYAMGTCNKITNSTFWCLVSNLVL